MGVTFHPPHISSLETRIPGAPESPTHLAPANVEDLSRLLRYASERELTVQIWGGGTHSGFGSPVPPAFVISMENLGELEVWEPEDLTIVVGAGARIENVEAMLAEKNQSLVMHEHPGDSTIGGAVSAGISSYRRGKLYPLRDRVLETTVVTGDGRIIRSGGRVVKNVSGYDLHRGVVGAFGSLGVVVSVCLKLWPTPPASATVFVDSLDAAGALARPLAVLEQDGQVAVYVAGTEAEVDGQVDRLGGRMVPRLEWPEVPDSPWRWSLRVPPAETNRALKQLPDGWSYVAVHGVGQIDAASATEEGADDLRAWAEAESGSLVMVAGDPDVFDPWGAPPPALELQRRIIAQFDPRRIINPGRLPGGL